ncbi:MAG: bifunctional oligoribonuclease/PAP phosphatase NrnA [Deltaproteobacteria bacterium]|nr:MAG: bifunctional oligoribonuclease/PAP phosphatase NrnA [Deltaproteobacteria bacterium]
MIDQIVKEIREGRRFLVASHQNPEGDAIGSSLALAIALKNLGKEVSIFNQDGVPKFLEFLPRAEEVSRDFPHDATFDCAFIVDCGDLQLLGEGFTQTKGIKRIINIDHHTTNNGYGDLQLVDPEASAAGELIYRLLKEIPAEITKEIAINIYTAILTDTGSFHYHNTTAESLRIAGEMIEMGVEPEKVAHQLYETQPLANLQLLALVLNTLEVTHEKKVASVTVLQEMFRRTGTSKEDTEGFVNYPGAIEGVSVALLFREINERKFKISFRAREDIDVSLLAQEFGGGGHQKAAGCTLEGTLPEVKEAVFKGVNKYL